MTSKYHRYRFWIPVISLLLTAGLDAKDYRGGEYRTLQSYLYGRFEVRMVSAAGSGVVSSFFTFRDYSAEGLSGRQHWNEIDLEWMGRRDNKVSTNVIIQNEWGDASEVFLTVNPHLDFNTYAFEWTPDEIRFYHEDRLLRTVSGERADSVYHPQKLMMNIWPPSNAQWAGTFNPDILPVYAIYDWASYATYTPGSGSVGTNNDFTPAWSDSFDYWDASRWQKATHTWDGNLCDFTMANVVLTDGYMVLCLTTPSETGYNGPSLGVDDGKIANPGDLRLFPAYPNPFNGRVNLRLETMDEQALVMNVYDTRGNLVYHAQLPGTAGHRQQLYWDGQGTDGRVLPSGSYIVQVRGGTAQSSQKVVLLK